jgi:toxin-antitoxin system PIN domain toxin
MFVVDTNVLVHAADERSPFHRVCLERLEAWRRQPSAWYLTWAIAYEFLRVVTHRKVLGRPYTATQAWGFVDALLASPGIAVLVATDRHASVLAATLAELPHLGGSVMHDAHTAILMREHGIRRIYTRDTDFHRFPFLEPIDPVA